MKPHRSPPHWVAALLACFAASGCITLKYGTPLVTSGLDDLEIGQSSRAEILLSLGQPRGSGAVSSIQHPDPRDILFYEYITSDGTNVELEIMTVFLHNDTYDGYLWFASSERMRRKGGVPYITPPKKAVAGFFPDTDRIETAFVRGETTRDQVLTVLDAPTGYGSANLPPDHRSQEVWFYEDIEITDIGSFQGEMWAEMRQRILLVMFHEDRFDGFMWYAHSGAAEGRQE